MNEYAARNALLRELGFPSYDDYLQSDLWKSIRRGALKRTCGKCVRCGRPARVVHHKDYSRETMLGHRPDSLIPVCCSCHRKAERAPGGEKRTQVEANLILAQDVRKRPKKLKLKPESKPETKEKDEPKAKKTRRVAAELILDAILERMGYRSLNDYFESPLFERIRRGVLRRANYRCHDCGDPAEYVRLLDFEKPTLTGNQYDRVRACCSNHLVGRATP